MDIKKILSLLRRTGKKGLSFLARVLPLAILMFSVNARLGAAFSENDTGTSGAQFLELGAGARASGMGGAYSAVADDPSAVYWNPAGLNRINRKSISVTHTMMFEDIYYDWVSCVKPLDSGGVLGIGVQYLSYGKIMETDATGLDIRNFNPNDLAVTGSYGFSINKIMLGISAKYISSKIKDAATAYAADAGAMYDLSGGKATLGLVVQNAGGKMKFKNTGDKLPFNIKFGGSYKIKSNWILSADANDPVDDSINFCAGTEYLFKISGAVVLAARAGYDTSTKDTGGLNGVTGGLGAEYGDYELDYAFSPFGGLGDVHRISFGVKF